MRPLQPQDRGYRFERWDALFSAFCLSPNPEFRIADEQIDGSFSLYNEIYLIEVKWYRQKTAARDLHTFLARQDQKATWTRGVFIGWQGFSPMPLLHRGGEKILSA
jgi:hypothetical protein